MKFFLAHSATDQELVTALGEFLAEDGHQVFDPASISGGTSILPEISSALRSADAVIAVVTSENPNILYELGIATGAGISVLVAAYSAALFPPELAFVPYVQLTGDRLRDAQSIARRANELRSFATLPSWKLESATETLNAAVRDRALLEALRPSDLEQLVRGLFEERGYTVTAAPSSFERAGDFMIESRRDNQLVVVEVKKLGAQGRVSVDAVRKLLSELSDIDASNALIVATSGFTAAALALAADSQISLRTLEEVLSAKSAAELFGARTLDD
jgi:Restriction endonuclease.